MLSSTDSLRLALRAGGAVLILAFPAMLLPFEWMSATHAWLGLGELPRVPIVNYLTRSAAALYGFHGILFFIVAADPARYRVIVRYLASMNVALGLMLLAIDLHAGLPVFWIVAEGPTLIGVGMLVAMLERRSVLAEHRP